MLNVKKEPNGHRPKTAAPGKPKAEPEPVLILGSCPPDAAEIFETVKKRMKEILSRVAFNDWIKPTVALDVHGNTIRVKVPNQRFVTHWKLYLHEQFEHELESLNSRFAKIEPVFGKVQRS